MTANPVSAVLGSALSSPDIVLPDEGSPDPLRLAGSAALGLAGAAIFLAITAVGGGVGSSNPLTLAAVPPLAAMLAFPPLYLLTNIRGRSPGLLRLLGVAIAGPSIAGVTLGAASPLLLLFALTGEIDVAFRALVALLAFGAVAAGAFGAIGNARRAGPSAPGMFIILGHYAFTLWTAGALALHLA